LAARLTGLLSGLLARTLLTAGLLAAGLSTGD
jgi:hypothetical protein